MASTLQDIENGAPACNTDYDRSVGDVNSLSVRSQTNSGSATRSCCDFLLCHKDEKGHLPKDGSATELQRDSSHVHHPQQRRAQMEEEEDEDAILESATISEYVSPNETKAIAVLRIAVVATWLLTAIIVSCWVYFTAVNNQLTYFENQFQVDAGKILESFHLTIDKRLAAANTMATSITRYARYSNSTFPFVTVPDFVVPGNNARILADAILVSWLPLVTDETREDWEAYALEHRQQADEAFLLDEALRRREDEKWGYDDDTSSTRMNQNPAGASTGAAAAGAAGGAGAAGAGAGAEAPTGAGGNTMQQQGDTNSTEPPFILPDRTRYHPRIFNPEQTAVVPDGSGLYLPVWQMSPASILRQAMLNADMGRLGGLRGILPYLEENAMPRGALLHQAHIPPADLAAKSADPIFTASQFRHSEDNGYEESPNTQLAYPVYDGFEEDSNFVGILTSTLNWRLALTDVLHPDDASGLICVIENSYGQVFSFQMDGPNAIFLGDGDPLLNDDLEIFQDMMRTHDKDDEPARRPEQRQSYTTLPLDEEYSTYKLKIYPTQDTYAAYQTNQPIIATSVVTAIFAMAAIVFLMYDYHVQKRQKAMMVKAIEQARNAANAERDLNEYLAHEVRNPLSAAITACSFVSAAVHDASRPSNKQESLQTVKDDIRIIDSSLRFINDLLRNMLDLHRAVNKRVAIRKNPADLFHDILEPVASMLYNRDAPFEVIVDCPENIIVETDCLRLKQVILNLGRNASKFVEKGFVRLRAEVVQSDGDCDDDGLPKSARIYVEDSGPGIPVDRRTTLFAKFQQSLELLSQGTGVGLNLCEHLVDIMGGDIWLDDTYNSGIEGRPGSRFVVDLRTPPSSAFSADKSIRMKPKDKRRGSDGFLFDNGSTSSDEGTSSMTQRSTVTLESQDGATVRPMMTGKRLSWTGETVDPPTEEATGRSLPDELSVLFVDDDMILRKLFCRSMKKAFPNWKVKEASSGETAIRLIEDGETFDLIFMDQYMASTQKQLLGTETVRELRAKGVTCKICGLSANDGKKIFLAAGADDFMLKPVPCKKEELETALADILYGKE